jgi:hypothetical protein
VCANEARSTLERTTSLRLSAGGVSGKMGQSARDVAKAAADEEAWSSWSLSGGDNDADADDEEVVPTEEIAGVAGPPG